MTPGKFYVFKDCFMVNRETGNASEYMLMIFACMEDGSLWPKPVVRWNCSKLPEGTPISTTHMHHIFEVAKTN
jgi:hypothetical protein